MLAGIGIAVPHGIGKRGMGMPEGDEWRKLLAGPLGVAFWSVVLGLWARRKKSASADTRDPQKARNIGYLFGRKVRRFWRGGI